MCMYVYMCEGTEKVLTHGPCELLSVAVSPCTRRRRVVASSHSKNSPSAALLGAFSHILPVGEAPIDVIHVAVIYALHMYVMCCGCVCLCCVLDMWWDG